ncbi:MAG: sigma-70 family RNA polymerase sigma factor [Chitinophagaceae bacterium]
MDQLLKNFWKDIYQENIGKLIGICYRYTGSRQVSEDIAHHAFLIAIDKFPGFKNQGPLEAWLRKIAVNESLQWIRTQKKVRQFEAFASYHLSDNVIAEEMEEPQHTSITKNELLHIINQLPGHHRLVFNLFMIDHFSHAEIAAQLGIAEGTSKSHLARAKKKIRLLLAKNKSRDKKGIMLLSLFYGTRHINISRMKKLHDFSIQPRHAKYFNISRNSTINTKVNSIIHYNSYSHVTTALKVATVGIVAISISYFGMRKDNTMISTGASTSVNPTENKISATQTATANGNSIIPEQTKKSENMKRLIPAGAVLLSSFAPATPQITPSILPTITPHQVVVTTPDHRTDTSIITVPVSGTIYASKLSWKAENYSIGVSGSNVVVNLNTQHFTGSGKFSFIDNVHLVVIDGTAIALNSTVDLAAKTYTFIQLNPEEAARKYGEKGKSGAVEIDVKK